MRLFRPTRLLPNSTSGGWYIDLDEPTPGERVHEIPVWVDTSGIKGIDHIAKPGLLKRVIAGSPLVQSPTRTLTPALRKAERTASRSIAPASLALHVRHQSAVK